MLASVKKWAERKGNKMKNIRELADVDAAKMTEVFSKLVLEGAQEERKLSEVVAASVENLKAGSGSTVKITYFPARTAEGPIAEGDSVTGSASTMESFSVVIGQYADYDFLNGFSLFEAGDDVKIALLNAMGKGFAAKFDATVYAAMADETDTPVTKTLVIADGLAKLVDAIVDAKAEMAKIGAKPEYVLMGPVQEAELLKLTLEGMPAAGLMVVTEGELKRIAGLKAIVTTQFPDTYVDGEIQAIVLDKSRAVAEAYGMRPTFEEKRDEASNTYKEYVWAYYGVSVLDDEGRVLIKQADA